MERVKLNFVLMLFFFLRITPALCQTPMKPTEKTVFYLNTFRTEFSKHIPARRPALLEEFYAGNIRLMPPFQKTVMGKGNATLYHEAFLKRFTIHGLTRTEMEIVDLGSQVMESGTFTIRVTLISTGIQHTLTGKYLDLWEEADNGDLKLITDAWNFNQHYGELHDQLRFPEVPSLHTALLPNVVVNDNLRFELSALNRMLHATVTEHDGNNWSRFFADDAMLFASYYPPNVGRKAIDDYIGTHVQELPVFEGLDIRNDHVDDLGRFAVEYASHIASWKNGASSGVSMGKDIRVWRRGEDCSLKLFRTIGMYD
jgi:ketosteroid isomerase-like protein